MERGATDSANLSLNALLPLLGWRSEPRTEGHRGKRIFDQTGAFVDKLRDPKFYTARTKRAVNSGGVS